jgi:hypothetical protein
MKIRSSLISAIVASAGLAIANFALAHNAIEVGHKANGQLFPHWHQKDPSPISVSNIPTIPGWADIPVGIEAIVKDEPGHDLFVLADNCSIEFIVVAADPNVMVWNENSSAPLPVGGADSFVLGAPFFHYHPIWSISEAVYGQTFDITLVFKDKSGQYTDSDPVTVTFTPHCPGDVNIDTVVDVDDLLGVINAWGECPECGGECPADLDKTCVVDVDDLLGVINAWGNCNK